MKKTMWLVIPIAIAMSLGGFVSQAQAVPGDNLRTIIADRTGTACASFDPDGNHGGVGVGIAFDGTNLLISCSDDNTITVVRPSDGSQVQVHNVSGATQLGALAWDNGRGLLWACSGLVDVGTIDLTTDQFTRLFESAGCFDGLAYDASDDTLWSGQDVASSIEHYTTSGTLLSSNPVTGMIGSCGKSGIAVGGAKLYVANNGCSEIYEIAKDFSSSVLFAQFPARLEDLECDNITFESQGKAAIWSTDAYDNILNAWEIPTGSCLFGGGNQAPIAADDAAQTRWGTNVTINVLANDSDPNADPLTVTGVTDPPNGTATVNPDSTVTYDPDGCFVGTDSFTYTVEDGRGGTDTALVTVRVRKTSGRIC